MRAIDTDWLAKLQEQWTEEWHIGAGEPSAEELEELVMAEHRANFELWHEEDKARDPSATDAEIAAVKHAIDRLNQQRNDHVEQIDEWLLRAIDGQNPAAVLHSETPGMMLDRLSILTLKMFHTREESEREDATAEHRARNRDRLRLLDEQRTDLKASLREIFRAVAAGERRFKVYRQLKMYNDPELNPRVYRTKVGLTRG